MRADLKSLRLFAAIIDLGSISQGARRCNIALAAASKRMSELEAHAGLPLLVRRARGVLPTPAGHAVLAHARSVLSAMDRLDAELDDFRSGITGVVSIMANASSIAQFLPAQIGAFLRQHPMFKIDLQERASTDVVKAVLAGEADIGVIEGNTPAGELECLPYREDELVLLVATGHPLARRRRVSAEEMLRHDHIIVREGTALHRLLAGVAAELRIPLKVRMQVGSFDIVCRMAEQNVGVAVVPRQAAASQLRSMRLRCVDLDVAWRFRRHLVCIRRLPSLPHAARSLLQHLVSPEGTRELPTGA